MISRFIKMSYGWLFLSVCAALTLQNVRAQCGNPPGPCCVVAGSILYTVDNSCRKTEHCECADYKQIFSEEGEIGRCILPPDECLILDDESSPETFMK